MIKQILITHGGTAFNTYQDYLNFLGKLEIKLDDLRDHPGDWKNSLQKKLGKSYDVLRPKMPNKQNAKYKEWVIWFEKIVPLLDDGVILIGHSLGAAFLAKYLSKNKISKNVLATILIGAPMKQVKKGEKIKVEFSPPQNMSLFIKQSKNIYLIYSEDDPTVKIKHLGRYQKSLPEAKTIIFKNKGHFKQQSFPEIIKLIKTL